MSFEDFIVIVVVGFVVIFGVVVMNRQTLEEKCQEQKHVRHSQEWKACLKALSEQK